MKSANENVKQTESQKLLERFHIRLLAPDFRNHVGVPMTVLRDKPLSNAEYEALLLPLDATEEFLRTKVDETFTAAEVELLREFFASMVPSWKFWPIAAKPIRDTEMGLGMLSPDEVGAFLSWPDDTGENKPREVPVTVYYNLGQAESGFYVDISNGRLDAADPLDNAAIPRRRDVWFIQLRRLRRCED